jgi:cellulose synthase/poly-beta-1,6-N-acetylglucosamine synthase-like glycosyltransferase
MSPDNFLKIHNISFTIQFYSYFALSENSGLITHKTQMLIIILTFFIVVVAIQLSYYLGDAKFLPAKAQKQHRKDFPYLLLFSQNEEENVVNFIPLLAEQNYPDFEIVLIDDASSDGTLDIFEDFEKQYPNIRLVKVQNNELFWEIKIRSDLRNKAAKTIIYYSQMLIAILLRKNG